MDKVHISTKRIDGSRDIYRMTVDLNVLEHLGINLYSNIAAVLTEVVANVWDADAENVEITLDSEEKWIEIVDDGIGMSVEDMNDKYLRVGYRRRHEDPNFGKFTAKGRQVMGRKGLGKLSLFSVANSIEVQTAKEGT
ncbi:MAG: ATP-binding protein, partial [Gammaproteobacteria bacterium]|nr:ATP-binding protein [Gammaproteobacteria bacterium]